MEPTSIFQFIELYIPSEPMIRGLVEGIILGLSLSGFMNLMRNVSK